MGLRSWLFGQPGDTAPQSYLAEQRSLEDPKYSLSENPEELLRLLGVAEKMGALPIVSVEAALCVPAGFGPSGTPMGLQLIGHRGRDACVLNLGRAYEAATSWIDRQPAP